MYIYLFVKWCKHKSPSPRKKPLKGGKTIYCARKKYINISEKRRKKTCRAIWVVKYHQNMICYLVPWLPYAKTLFQNMFPCFIFQKVLTLTILWFVFNEKRSKFGWLWLIIHCFFFYQLNGIWMNLKNIRLTFKFSRIEFKCREAT